MLQNILEMTRNSGELPALLHEELPVRYAQRIAMLESLPDWHNVEGIASVRRMYIKSFKELRMIDMVQHGSPDAWLRCLQHINKRHTRTNLLVGGFKQYAQREELSEMQINRWLDRFFALRISTNLLIGQYLEMMSPRERKGEPFNPYQRSISSECCAYKIATHAAAVIQQLCVNWYGCSPEIHVVDAGSVPFTFVPRYLFYILSELLKNSVRATVEQLGRSPAGAEGVEMVPIKVIVCTGDGVTSIRISDEGGGIPLDRLSRIWSYMYTTAQPADIPISRESVDAPTDLKRLEMSMMSSANSLHDGDAATSEHRVLLKSPLAGLGCGLPLSRLYAQYLGGKVILHTMPRFGTDVFVYLNSLGDCSETLRAL